MTENITPMALTIPEATKATGISRTMLYLAMKSGELQAVKSGRITLIPYASLAAYVASLPPYKPRKPLG